MRDRRLEGIETVIKRQQRVAPKRDDGRLLSLREDRRTWLLWAGLEIIDRLPFTPLRNRLGIDPGSASRAKLAIAVLLL